MYMKKPYSLDYDAETTDRERRDIVADILNNLTFEPTQNDLNIFANYILYGKSEEDDKNHFQRKEITDDYDRRYKSWVSKNAKNESLDALLESPVADENTLQSMDERYIYTKKKRQVKRPKYDKKTGELLDPGDSDIPGMVELWESIDRLQHTLNVNTGKVPPDLDTPIIESGYRLYQLKHNLIDLRRNQFELIEMFKPALHFKALVPPKRQTINWGSNSAYWMPREEWERAIRNPKNIGRHSDNIADYKVRENYLGQEEVYWVVREHEFDWENYKHIQCLIHYYSAIYAQLWDDPDSWGRALIFDFDRYATMANLTEMREYMLMRRIDGASYEEIAAEVKEKFDADYTPGHLGAIISSEIPRTIAAAAKRNRLLYETPQSEKKQCTWCGRYLPRHQLFFGLNKDRKDGWMSHCKECDKKKRDKGGFVADGRSKDKNLSKMPTGIIRR